jgi:homoserine dehydrogenase
MRRYDFAICGFGNVGRALARHLVERAARVREKFDVDLRLTWVVDTSAAVFTPEGVDVEALTHLKGGGGHLADAAGARGPANPDEIRATGVEGIVVTLPTDYEHGEPGLTLARRALDCDLDVILGDKGPALLALDELEEHAARAKVWLGTSATTGSALPSLAVLLRWFAASRVDEITGILNATSNFVLTRMRDNTATYEEALNEAVLQGIAEADPRLDVEGFDTAIKLVILARGLMDPAANFAAGQIHGIADLSADLVRAQAGGGGRIRLIGRAVREDGRATISVAPTLIAPDDPLFFVDGAQKAIRFHGDDLGAMTVVGGASSLTGTASALLRDLIEAAAARK